MLTAQPCKEPGCGQHIVFLPTATGASMPVDAESLDPGDDEHTEYDSTRHVNHWGTCTKPGRFKSEKPKAPKGHWKYLRWVSPVDGEVAVAISGDRVRIKFAGKTREAKLADTLDGAAPIFLDDDG